MRETCYVYVVVARDEPDERGRLFVKVGISNNPWSRVREMQTGCPQTLDLLKTFSLPQRWFAFEVEQVFHKTNAHGKFQGEWYLSYPDSIIEEIGTYIIECCYRKDYSLRDTAHLCDESGISCLSLIDTWTALEENPS